MDDNPSTMDIDLSSLTVSMQRQLVFILPPSNKDESILDHTQSRATREVIPDCINTLIDVINEMNRSTLKQEMNNEGETVEDKSEMVEKELAIEQGGTEATQEQVVVDNKEVGGNDEFTNKELYGFFRNQSTLTKGDELG